MERFGLSPLIFFTLLSLYVALVLPLPFFAPQELRPLTIGILLLGFLLILGLLSEKVETDADGLRVRYPPWISWLFRRSWFMAWSDVRALVPVGTSQGGTVYYLKATGCRHQLLPQRIARFDRFLDVLRERTLVSTKGIGRLTPPWTYQVLAVLAILMIVGELATGVAIAEGLIT
ncbi:hypothetical protein [Synechococcus sp. M16CYN]|uniref:hypothetical protein n=1 Tax=Synechococcus sp. M16CYN TaxID=3103139 RepID=UPI00325465A1